jgi:2-aminoadipate transaminase
MQQSWESRFALNMKDFQGYSIGQLFKYLQDPELISLAGGLPAPEMFQTGEMQKVSSRLFGGRSGQYNAVQ